MNKVRVSSLYRYLPVLIDKLNPPYGAQVGELETGQFVRVVNLPGCPRANTMGHCHIENPYTGKFLGLVCTNSLEKLEKSYARAVARSLRTAR